LAGLFSVPLIDIGFTSIKLKGYSLRELLGYGRFSAVYSAVKNDTGREVVVKVFSGDDDCRGVTMRDNETLILSELLRGNNDGSSSSASEDYNSTISHHVPQVIEVGHTFCEKPVLVMDKIGYPLQPLDKG
jgi:serine/threonine protein kinase